MSAVTVYTCPDCGGDHVPAKCAGALCDCCAAIGKAMARGEDVERVGPASHALHVMEGICHCIHVGLKRVAVTHCGLSSHRVEAAAARELAHNDAVAARELLRPDGDAARELARRH